MRPAEARLAHAVRSIDGRTFEARSGGEPDELADVHGSVAVGELGGVANDADQLVRVEVRDQLRCGIVWIDAGGRG